MDAATELNVFCSLLERSVCSFKEQLSNQVSDPVSEIERAVESFRKAIGTADEIDIDVLPLDFRVKKVSIYRQEDKSAALSAILSHFRVRVLTFTKTLSADELRSFSKFMAASEKSLNDNDLDFYSAFKELNLESVNVQMPSVWEEAIEDHPEIRDKFEDFAKRIKSKVEKSNLNSARRLRPDDLKVLEEFRINPALFTKSDDEVSAVLKSSHHLFSKAEDEKKSLERLLGMGFHFLDAGEGHEQRQMGRDMVCRSTLFAFELKFYDLVEAVIDRVAELQQLKYDQTGEFQKVVDTFFHPDHLVSFSTALNLEAEREIILRILSKGSSFAVRLSILLLARHPWLKDQLSEFIAKNFVASISWVSETMKQDPHSRCWEELLAILAEARTPHLTRYHEMYATLVPRDLRFQGLKRICTISSPETTKILLGMVSSSSEFDRMQGYELLALARNRPALDLIQRVLSGNSFEQASPKEKEIMISVFARLTGRQGVAYLVGFWNKSGQTLLNRRQEIEKRLAMISALFQINPLIMEEVISKVDPGTLSSEINDVLFGIRDRLPSNEESSE